MPANSRWDLIRRLRVNEGEEFQHVSVIMNNLIPFKGKQRKYITKQIVIIIIISV